MSIFGNLFNRNNKNSAKQPPAGPTQTPWDQLRNQPFAGDAESTGSQTPEADEKARLKRQGDKLVAMYFQGPQVLNQESVQVTDDMRDRFAFALASMESNGGISQAERSQMLQNIALPSDTPHGPDFQSVFTRVNDKHGRTIMSYVLNVPDQQLSSDSLGTFLSTFPTPIEFAPHARDLLADLRKAGNTAQKLFEYETDLEKFQSKVYGKRYEYNQALKELEQQGYNRANRYRQAAMEAADARDAARRAEEHRRQIEQQNDPEFVARYFAARNRYSAPESKPPHQDQSDSGPNHA